MSFPRYPSYKDSGVEWLGEVPGHWSLPKLKHFTSYSGGGTPSRVNLVFWNGDIPWVTPKGMKTERILGAEECITESGLKNSSTSLLPIGMVLLVVRSGILKHTIPVAINEVPVALNQDMKALSFTDDSCLNAFFLRWVQGLNDLLLLAWAKQGATVESIEHTYLAETIIPLPPFTEQQTIAAFLDRETAKIDALIAEQQRLIALLKEKRQAVISHAVTKGLSDLLPSPCGGGAGGEGVPMKDSGIAWLGEVPAHWEIKRLRFVAQLNPSKGEIAELDKETEVSFLPMEAIGDDGSLSLDRTRPIREIESGYTYFREGDVTIAKITPCFENGKGAVMRSLYGGIGFGTTELIVARPYPSGTINNYLHWLFISKWFRKHGEASMYGAGGQKRVPDDFVRNFFIGFPPIPEQEIIAVFLDQETTKLDNLTAEARRAIALLKERRSVLISAAVTGKIDVRGFVDSLPDSNPT